MKVDPRDLATYERTSLNYWMSMGHGIRLVGQKDAMTPQQRNAVAQIEAAAAIFIKAGLIRSEDVDKTLVECDYPDSDPATEP